VLEESGPIVAGRDNLYSVALAAGCAKFRRVRRSRFRPAWTFSKVLVTDLSGG
jgi:hypothetical protein